MPFCFIFIRYLNADRKACWCFSLEPVYVVWFLGAAGSGGVASSVVGHGRCQQAGCYGSFPAHLFRWPCAVIMAVPCVNTLHINYQEGASFLLLFIHTTTVSNHCRCHTWNVYVQQLTAVPCSVALSGHQHKTHEKNEYKWPAVSCLIGSHPAHHRE